MKDDVLLVKDVVEKVLKADMRSRDNDKWLSLMVQRSLGFHIFIPFDEIDRMPSFESISRARRKFQEEGLYLPNMITAAGRKEEEKNMRGINKWF